MKEKIHVTIFNEHNQDRSEPVKSIYPDGIHAAIAKAFEGFNEFSVVIATQDMPCHGLSEEVLASTDVLIWWSHIDNAAFDEEIADRICYHVLNRGMGFIAIHASIFFQTLAEDARHLLRCRAMGTLPHHAERRKRKTLGIQSGTSHHLWASGMH